MRHNIAKLAAVAALAVGAVACNDDDGTTQVQPAPDTTSPVTTAPGTSPPTTEADDDDDVVRGFAGSWLPEHIEELELTEATSIPAIDEQLAEERIAEDYWIWDWWPVRDRSGEVAEIEGWNIVIALTAPDDVLPGQRHDVARMRYFLTQDGGETWIDGDQLLPDGMALGTREWAGSTMYDAETQTMYVFYTAAGEDDEDTDGTTTTTGNDTTTTTDNGADGTTTTTDNDTGDGTVVTTTDAVEGLMRTAPTTTEPDTDDMTTTTENGNGDDEVGPSGAEFDEDISYRQRMALTTATLTVENGELQFGEWTEHEAFLTGEETEFYASTQETEGGAGDIAAFRDPWYYFHEETGEEYVLFTATMPESGDCDGDGIVGIARATNQDLTEWEVMPPMLDAHCVNNELERPHIIEENGLYYLLFTTHSHTFRDGTSGPEGLYGFVADDLMGPYEPLNGSGLVLGNPEDVAYQSYSWMTLPGGVVTSFFQFMGIDGSVEIDYIGDQDPEFQMESFAGTFAPSLVIEFDGDQTRLVRELAPGQLFP
jgi:levansucrase